MTELKRIMVDGPIDLVIYKTEPPTIAVCIEPAHSPYIRICLAQEATELEALVAARVALFKLYKACTEPPRSQPKPVEDAKV